MQDVTFKKTIFFIFWKLKLCKGNRSSFYIDILNITIILWYTLRTNLWIESIVLDGSGCAWKLLFFIYSQKFDKEPENE